MKKILKLFANCLPVKGATRQIICDLQKGNFYFIPQGLYEILTAHKGKRIDEIKSFYNNNHDEVIDKYISYLIENELAFFCSNPESFPEIEIKWDYPGHISNAIIEVEQDTLHDFIDMFFQLEKLGTKFLEIRFYYKTSLNKLTEIISLTNESKFRNIDILLEYDSSLELKEIEHFINLYQRIGKIIIHSVPESHIEKSKNINIVFTKQVIKNNDCCGQVSVSYFNCNLDMYMESKLHNNCLNRKISINGKGEIKNCPSANKAYGNIQDITLKQAIEKQGFKDYWSINKDQIEICKDCEFRYICTDCRAHLSNPQNIYSKPAKCTYNPYTGIWDDEKDNPLTKFRTKEIIS